MKWHKTKYPGIRYRESEAQKHNRRPDRSFVIHYKRNGKLINETIGWESQGATLAEAAQIRGQIIQNIRRGEGFQSLNEKREMEETRRQERLLEQERIEKENLPFDELAEKYICWAKTSKKTWWVDAGAYKKHIKKALGHLPIQDISVLTLERLKRALQTKGLSERTIQCYLNVVKHMFNKGLGWGLCSGKNPVSETAKVDKKFLRISDNRRLRFLSFEEAEILLTELEKHSPQLHNISFLSLHTGLRAGEIFNLTWQDLDFKHGIITVRNPKNGESRQTYMSVPIKNMFLSLQNNSGLIFKDRYGRKIREVSTTFDRVVKNLGFNNGINDRRNKLVFHSLRHTFASWLALQGETLLTIMELMGHKDIKMTLRYAHLIPDQKKRAILNISKNTAQRFPTVPKQNAVVTMK